MKAHQKNISNTSDLYANNKKTCMCALVGDAVDERSSNTIGIHKKPCVAVREYPIPFLGSPTGKNNTIFALDHNMQDYACAIKKYVIGNNPIVSKEMKKLAIKTKKN